MNETGLLLNGKVAVVTGASSGLGKSVVELLCAEGTTVYALARTIEKCDFPTQVTKIQMNIRDLDSIDHAFSEIDAHDLKIDILVNCAGRGLVKKFEHTSRDEIMDVLGINLKGNIYIAQEVYRRMLPNKSGHIVMVNSTSGVKARPDETIYCASKWGLRGFSESLRLAAAEHKIRVTSIFPGGMNTNFWKSEENKDLSGYMDPKIVAGQILSILRTPASIAPSEYVIERGFYKG